MMKTGTMLRLPAIAVILACLMSRTSRLYAAELNSSVKDHRGKPVKDAVVYLTDLSGKPEKKPAATAMMDQKNKEFVPHVLPVQTGTSVSFPNSDNIYHHVYSFSPARRFELPLYKGKPVSPVIFDKPGIVVLGCNIHDWMLGYIVVLETPYFAVTRSDGRATVEQLPAGDYNVRVWHPDMMDPVDSAARKITVKKMEKSEFTIKLKAKIRVRRSPDTSGGMGY